MSSILLVDDDPGAIRVLGRALFDMGELHFATGGAAALRLAHESAFDLILLDVDMPRISGFQVCKSLKAEAAMADVPIIFVTGHADTEFEVAAFGIGAADFIAKPVSVPLLRARVQAQLNAKHASDALRRVSITDGLTDVANRRRFEECLAQEWRRARRTADPLSLLMIDVDHFKLFNDHYGHPAGDEGLRQMAHAIAGASVRPGDLVARYGGEEFVVLLPQTTRQGAAHLAVAILAAVASLEIANAASPTAPHLTVSIGVASLDDDSAWWPAAPADSRHAADMIGPCLPATLVRAADTAMYAAKAAGRGCAMLLDIADFDAPDLAIEITPASGPSTRPG